MAYSTLLDIKKSLPEIKIIELTDDYQNGEIDTKVADDAIDQADNTIDGYLRGRYPADIPDGEVPELISDISTKLAIYNLHRRRVYVELPETIMLDYKWAITQLEKIQRGDITPFPITSEPQKIQVSTRTRKFSEDLWARYR